MFCSSFVLCNDLFMIPWLGLAVRTFLGLPVGTLSGLCPVSYTVPLFVGCDHGSVDNHRSCSGDNSVIHLSCPLLMSMVLYACCDIVRLGLAGLQAVPQVWAVSVHHGPLCAGGLHPLLPRHLPHLHGLRLCLLHRKGQPGDKLDVYLAERRTLRSRVRILPNCSTV